MQPRWVMPTHGRHLASPCPLFSVTVPVVLSARPTEQVLLCSSTTRFEADADFGEFVAPLHQLAVLIVLLQVRRTKHDIPNVYFQDPDFQPVENQFLESLGYILLDDPEAFDLMSPSTFLFAPYCPEDVNYRALDFSFPALYIGNDPRLVTSSILYRQSGLERMRVRRVLSKSRICRKNDDQKWCERWMDSSEGCL